MDPLSVTASILALIGCCRQLQKGLRILRQLSVIPDEIASLTAEIHDFQNVLAAISVVTKQRLDVGGLAECPDSLLSLLVRAADLISSIGDYCGVPIDRGDLHGSVDGRLNSPVNLDLLTRFRWIKDKKNLEEKRGRLKCMRLDLANHLHSLTLADSCTILTELRDLATVFRRLSVDKEAVQSLIASSQPQTAGLLMQKSTSDLPDDTTYSEKASFEREMQSTCHGNPPPAYECHAEALPISHCSCSCHRVNSFKTPQLLESVIGSLTVRATGTLGNREPACDEIACSKRKHASVKVTYRFPPWLFNRTINSIFFSGAAAGPQMNLTLTREAPSNSDVFCFAMQGNIDGLKNLFTKGLASPFDITHNYGYTALHYATDYGHRDLASFLLKIGARAEIEDYSGRTSTDIAYHALCNSKAPEGHGNRMWELFDKDSWVEEKQFTVLHKIVIGITRSSKHLHDQLSISTKGINDVDSGGRTPLSWAAERGDRAAVSTLIQFGADTSLGDKDGNTPLHYACKADGLEVVRLFCDHGVDAASRNTWGQTPLNWATFYQDDPAFAKELLAQPGVSLDDVDESGSTLVGNAAFSCHDQMLSYLLDIGADANHVVDGCGTNPLLDCISNNSHASFNVLLRQSLQCSINLAHRDSVGEHVLHHLARKGDVQMVNIFSQALQDGVIDIAGLSLTHLGQAGLTPHDLLMLRGDSEVQNALGQALVLIARENDCGQSEESIDTLRYADAFELLPELEKAVGIAA